MPTIELITLIPATPEQCFELSLSVDAHTASMAESGERAIDGVTSGVLSLGDVVTWKATHFGVPFTLTSVISSYDAPRTFVDEQTSGPFRRWWHQHRFEPVDGGTLMTDFIEFESPAGVLGRAANALVLTRYMTHLMRQRNEWLVEALSEPTSRL